MPVPRTEIEIAEIMADYDEDKIIASAIVYLNTHSHDYFDSKISKADTIVEKDGKYEIEISDAVIDLELQGEPVYVLITKEQLQDLARSYVRNMPDDLEEILLDNEDVKAVPGIGARILNGIVTAVAAIGNFFSRIGSFFVGLVAKPATNNANKYQALTDNTAPEPLAHPESYDQTANLLQKLTSSYEVPPSLEDEDNLAKKFPGEVIQDLHNQQKISYANHTLKIQVVGRPESKAKLTAQESFRFEIDNQTVKITLPRTSQDTKIGNTNGAIIVVDLNTFADEKVLKKHLQKTIKGIEALTPSEHYPIIIIGTEPTKILSESTLKKVADELGHRTFLGIDIDNARDCKKLFETMAKICITPPERTHDFKPRGPS